MQLSLSRRFLAYLLAFGLLTAVPATAYDSDYADEKQEVNKSKKNKKKKKAKTEEDYWDEDSWDDDEVEPVTKKKKKKKKKKASKKKKAKTKKQDDDDSWDSWDDDDDADKVSADDAEDFFSDDEPPRTIPHESELDKTAMGGARKKQDSVKQEPTPRTTQPIAPPRDPRAECVELLRHNPAAVEHVEFVVIHPDWKSRVRVNKEHRVLLALHLSKGKATVLELNERELRVKWDDWGEELFLRQPDNTYMLDSMVKRSGKELSRKAKRTAARLRSRKAVAWDDYGWTGWLLDYISGNEQPLTYETFRMVRENMDCKVRFSEDEKVLVKMTGDHEAASVLAYTGVKLHVRWESGQVETYKRLEDGSYRKIDDERVARQLLDPDKCVREKSEDDWFVIWWRDFMNEEKPLSYVNVEMRKGKQEYRPRLSMDNRLLVQTPPHKGWAKVIKYDRKQLIIRWDGVREELYERDDENAYHYVK